MNKKKLWLLAGAVALILTLVLVLILTPKKTTKKMEERKLPQIGLCLRQYAQAPQYGKLLESTFREAGFSVTILDAKNDQSRQTEQIREFLRKNPALLVIEPVILDGAEDTVSLLKEKNVPAVWIGHKPDTQWERLGFVGSREDQLGALQGQIVLQSENRGDLNEDGQISCLVLTGPETDKVAKAQAEGSIDALVTEGLLVEQMETSWGDWTAESGRIRCAKALSQYGKDIEVILCGSEEITLGAMEAINAGGWKIGRDYCLVGVGAEEKLQSDCMTGTVTPDLDKMAQKVLVVAQALIAGETVEQENYVNLRVRIAETEET